MLNYQLHQLDSGLNLITAPMTQTRAVSIFLLFGVGSRYENSQNNGISHFLEHMFFKGTKKRPTTLDISRDLDNVGAHYNAYTGEEYTGYYVQVSSEHFDLGLDVLTDMLFNSKFDEAEIAKEKGVIVEEINMVNDDPRGKVELVAKELVYPDQPLGWKITGEKTTVTKFNRQNFIDYKEKYYKNKNLVVAVAGGGDQKEWVDKISQKFAQFSGEHKADYLPVKENQTEPQVKFFKKDTDQAHFILGYRAIKRTDERRQIMKVMNNLMGQMMSSRLFIEVREKRGLCYYVYSDVTDFNDTGFWSVSAGVDINRTEEAIKVIMGEINRLKDTLLTDEELKRAKENLKGHLYLGLEESMAVAQYLAEQQLFWNKITDPEDLAKEYEKVTSVEIKKLVNAYFKPANLNLAMVGPFDDETKFKKIIK